MKQFLPFIFVFLFANVHAQIVVTPEESTHDTLLNLTDLFSQDKIHADIINTGTTDVDDLQWSIVQVDGPSEWYVQLCVDIESGGCFGWEIMTNIDPSLGLNVPLALTAGDTSIFDLGMRPDGKPGCGTFEIRVHPISDPTNVLVVGTFHFMVNVNADCTLVSSEDFEKSKVYIFPNPTKNYFIISENEYVEEVEVYNAVGKMVLSENYYDGITVDLSAFSDGFYLVKMRDKEGQVFKSSKLAKR